MRPIQFAHVGFLAPAEEAPRPAHLASLDRARPGGADTPAESVWTSPPIASVDPAVRDWGRP